MNPIRVREHLNPSNGFYHSDDRYWDIFIETAKDTHDVDEILFRVTAYNRGPEAAPLHIIPQVYFRNTWAWGHEHSDKKPSIEAQDEFIAKTKHWKLGERIVQLSPSPGVTVDSPDVNPKLIFTDNDTNYKSLYGVKNKTEYVKDAFHRYIVDDEKDAVNPAQKGTKAAAWYAFDEGEGVPPGGCAVVRFKMSKKVEIRSFIDGRGAVQNDVGINEETFDDMFELRRYEADQFYYDVFRVPGG